MLVKDTKVDINGVDRMIQLHKEVNSPNFYINLTNSIKMPKNVFSSDVS